MEPAEIKKMETFLGRLEHVAIRRSLMPEALERVAKAAAALLDVSHLKHKNLKVRLATRQLPTPRSVSFWRRMVGSHRRLDGKGPLACLHRASRGRVGLLAVLHVGPR